MLNCSKKETNFFSKLLQGGRSYVIILYFIVLCAIVGLISPNFLSATNIVNNLRSASYYGIIGMGMTLVFVSGGLDLSVGSEPIVLGDREAAPRSRCQRNS